MSLHFLAKLIFQRIRDNVLNTDRFSREDPDLKMHSFAFLNSIFLVVIRTLALPQYSRSVAGASSLNAITKPLASSSAPFTSPISPDKAVVVVKVQWILNEIVTFETTPSKEKRSV